MKKELRMILKQLEKVEIPDDRDEIPTFINQHIPPNKPSMKFGIETALYSIFEEKVDQIFHGSFCQGKYRISINGLVWMVVRSS